MIKPNAELRAALTRAISGLNATDRLIVVELSAEGLTVFDIERTEAGLVEGHASRLVAWSALTDDGELVRASALESATMAVIVRTFAAARTAHARDLLLPLHAGAVGLDAQGVDLAAELRETIADEPLKYLHELVTVRRMPDDRLELTTIPLFPKEARRDAVTDLHVICPPGSDEGIVFALISEIDGRLKLLSARTARLSPGEHRLTVRLSRAGRIRLEGPPVQLVPEQRSWPELINQLPARFVPPPRPSHLACAIETSGPAAQVVDRISRVQQLLNIISRDPGGANTRVSLLSYGPHYPAGRRAARKVEVLAWDRDVPTALDRLVGLAAREPAELGYDRASQLECALEEIARRSDTRGSAPTALLVVGDRPAHPHKINAVERLPCPDRVDWHVTLHRLQRRGLRTAAICDRPAMEAEQIWQRLGGDSGPAALDTVNVRPIGRRLGLLSAETQRIPFPMTRDSE